MKLHTIGIMSMGDMGSGIAAVLTAGGARVLTCLEGRSELTRLRAAEAGAHPVASLDEFVTQADLVLSVLVPAQSRELAEQVAAAMRRTGAHPPFVDCNAISPQTVIALGRTIQAAGAPFIDAGIIGSPPRPGRSGTRIYCSGPDTGPLLELRRFGLDVRSLGPQLGQASGLKMVYAASTKGTTALWTELLVAARRLGLGDALEAEMSAGRPDVAEALTRPIGSMPRRARRWVGEMEEIAATFAELGLTPLMLQGAAEMYRLVGGTPLADQTSRQPDPSPDEVMETLARKLAADAGG